MIAALLGGFYSGLFATIMSCFTTLFLWPLFVNKPYINDFGDWLSLSVFVFTSMMISFLCENLLKEKEKVKEMNVRLELSNQKLKQEVEIRIDAEDEIIKLNRELEDRVLERTEELEHINSILSKSEEKFRQTLDNMIVGCQILDYEWKYTYINDSADIHNRVSKDRLLGNRYMDMWPGIETTMVFGIIKDCMEKRCLHHFENEFIYPDGSKGWFDLSIQPVPEGVIILSYDITERKLAEENIFRLNRELEQKVADRTMQLQDAVKDLESFSYSVSHDLRAPLRHIMGFIDILCKKTAKNLDEEGKRYLSIILNSAKNMGLLIDELLSFSRIGRAAVKKTQVDFSPLIAGIIEDFREERDKRNVNIKINDMPVVFADPNLLRLVWVNLISNSIKYTGQKENAEIEIGFESDEGGRFYIKDNGAGFDMDYYDKLFGVFQRLHGSGEFEGTGIGLANVKKIIDKHEGKIWAEGKVGEGAVFYFTLPVKAGE
jgi:PAS domain S-box-containing protein